MRRSRERRERNKSIVAINYIRILIRQAPSEQGHNILVRLLRLTTLRRRGCRARIRIPISISRQIKSLKSVHEIRPGVCPVCGSARWSSVVTTVAEYPEEVAEVVTLRGRCACSWGSDAHGCPRETLQAGHAGVWFLLCGCRRSTVEVDVQQVLGVGLCLSGRCGATDGRGGSGCRQGVLSGVLYLFAGALVCEV